MGCFFLVLIFVALIIFIRVYSGPGPKTYSRVPQNFPRDIPVYDPDNIEKVTYISGKYKSRNVELAALAPKLLLSPLLIALNKDTNGLDATTTRAENLKNIIKIVMTPVGDHKDTLQIEWRNIDAEPSFVASYYITELKKKGFAVTVLEDNFTQKKFSFERNDGIEGTMLVQGDEENKPGTDYALLTVNLGEPIEVIESTSTLEIVTGTPQ